MMQMNRMVPAAVCGKSRDVLGIRSSPALLTPTSLSRNCYRRGRSTLADTVQILTCACPSLTTRSGKTPHRPANVCRGWSWAGDGWQ